MFTSGGAERDQETLQLISWITARELADHATRAGICTTQRLHLWD